MFDTENFRIEGRKGQDELEQIVFELSKLVSRHDEVEMHSMSEYRVESTIMTRSRGQVKRRAVTWGLQMGM